MLTSRVWVRLTCLRPEWASSLWENLADIPVQASPVGHRENPALGQSRAGSQVFSQKSPASLMVADEGVSVQGTLQEAHHGQEEHGIWIQKTYRGLLDPATALIPPDHVTFLCLSFQSVKWGLQS